MTQRRSHARGMLRQNQVKAHRRNSMLWRVLLTLTLHILPTVCQAAETPNDLDIQDVWGRSLKQAGITLVDWDGYLANPAVRLTIQPPAAATFPATVRLSANGPRLYFDELGKGS